MAIVYKVIIDCSPCDDESVIEVIEVNIYSFLPKIFDMTAIKGCVTVQNEPSNSESSSNSECEEDRLSLAYESLAMIPQSLLNRFGSALQMLDISHNRISNVDFLIYLPNLTSLIADNNLINEETIFPSTPNLQLLWLNHCKINVLYPWIKKLNLSCPKLKHLCLMGNVAAPSYLNGGTFYEYLQYRLFVISLFTDLIHLDDRAVTDDQRNEAKRLYKRPLLERLVNFNNNEYPIPAAVQSRVMDQWRSMFHKLFGFLETHTNGSATNSSRNLLI